MTLVLAGTRAAIALSSPSQSLDSYFLTWKNRFLDQAVLQLASPVEATSCSGPVTSNTLTFWLDQQDQTGVARGYAPFLPDDSAYPVYRNVKSYNAVGYGKADDTQNLQTAINDDENGGNRYNKEISTRPAEVFVPVGTYKLTK
ncbi:MAG: hypothetical protein ASARMPRED_008466 [Alectoria sarmentosa]|nr:MAG: hypothetical protein ASARMPRED_008466 [Alectoria sarmentosa]